MTKFCRAAQAQFFFSWKPSTVRVSSIVVIIGANWTLSRIFFLWCEMSPWQLSFEDHLTTSEPVVLSWEIMSTAPAPNSSRLLPKIVYPASQLQRDDQDKITVEVRKLASAAGSRSWPHSYPEMSVEQLLISSSRIGSQHRHRTSSARHHRGVFSAGHRPPQCLTVDEVKLRANSQSCSKGNLI